MKPYLVGKLDEKSYKVLRYEEPVGGSRARIVLQHKQNCQKFLFKTYSKNPREIWAELFASNLGNRLGIDIQKVSIKTISGEMKNKFQKANEKLPLDWIPIGVLVRHAFPREFDIRYGKSVIAEDSNYFSLEEIENKIRDRYYAPEKILVAFADMIIFDALIGNMDRHHDNWGILEHMLVKSGQTSIDPKELVSKIRFATLFDHGSSLLFELEEDTVERYLLDPELFKQKYTLGTNYTFFLNQNRGSENIFSLIKWYIDNTIDWKKRFKDSIRKMLDGINNYDFSKLLVKMPQNQELDYSEKRKALLLNSLSLRKFILTSYL